MVDWGGKVAAWFAAVAAASAALAALIAATAKQPFHGWLRVLFIILVIIAGVSFIVLLLTGPRAAWAAWRSQKVADRGPARRPQSSDAVDDTINLAEPRSPDLQRLRGTKLLEEIVRGLDERPKVSGGDVTSTISGGSQYGPVVQGRDFTDLTFSAGPAAPAPDPGMDREARLRAEFMERLYEEAPDDSSAWIDPEPIGLRIGIDSGYELRPVVKYLERARYLETYEIAQEEHVRLTDAGRREVTKHNKP